MNKSQTRSRGRPEAAIERSLREVRRDGGWTLTELAAHAAISPARLSQIERGRVVTTPRELAALERAIGDRGRLELRLIPVHVA